MVSRALDQRFVSEAIALAGRGRGWTSPNPMVGALIVKNGKVIARGYHKRVGGPHAEIEALRAASKNVEGATLYTNLEPCSHHGRTPPCADAIIRAGIKRVVCSTRDPNPRVSGKGIARLKKAGIAVSVGTMEKEARDLNEQFFTFQTKKRPYVSLKFAASIDGKLGRRNGKEKWITNENARAYGRKLRGEHQAILVGINTILRDNPHLGARTKGARDPLRIILDSRLRIPLNARVLWDSNVLIATTSGASRTKKKALEKRGILIIAFPGGRVPLRELLSELYKREIVSVLVEGGGETLGNFIKEDLFEAVYAFYAPVVLGSEGTVTIGEDGISSRKKISRLTITSTKSFGDNILVVAKQLTTN